MAQIQAAVAEFERTRILERNRRGKLWRARQGAVINSRAPYGYVKVAPSDGLPARLEICEDKAAVVRSSTGTPMRACRCALSPSG